MINYQKQAFAIVVAFFFCSCQEKMTEDEISKIGIESCRKPAAFISKIGFNPLKSAFTSSDNRIKGIVLIEAGNSLNDTLIRKWQEPSWAQYGHMGPITTDENGNAFTAPIPFVNNLENTLATIHQIFKINQQTGKMEPFIKLPKIDSIAGINAFGILGLYYDCHGKKLYVSSVGGSTQDDEKGSIYVIDPINGDILDQLKGYDAMGLFVGGITGQKALFFGHARSSEIFSIELSKEGKFIGKAKKELSLDGLGPRGMDKARRIRFDKFGNLLIHGIEFNYNLSAQTEKLESLYKFGYNITENKWQLLEDVN
jgi:hypothetical protein